MLKDTPRAFDAEGVFQRDAALENFGDPATVSRSVNMQNAFPGKRWQQGLETLKILRTQGMIIGELFRRELFLRDDP